MNSIRECYRVETRIGGRVVRLDMNFNEKSVEEATLRKIAGFLESLEQIDNVNKKHYHGDFDRQGETAEYIEFYLEELPEEALAGLVDRNQNLKTQRMQLLNRLELIRVGMYPDEQEKIGYFGVFDYSVKIEGEYCNQLLVVKTKDTGAIDHITWES